jgi:peptidase M48-like protein
MFRTVLLVSLALLSGGCSIGLRPKMRPFEPNDFMIVYPHLAVLMKAQGDLPPRADCPIDFGVLDSPALNAWVSVRPEPRTPTPPVKPVGEIKEAPPVDPGPPLPPRCRQFNLTVTAGALALPRDELRAVLAHELGHVYLGHVQSTHDVQTLRYIAEVAVVGIIPFLVIHSGTYPFMDSFNQAEETTADRFAVDLLNRSRSSCRALAAVLERFQRAQERSSNLRFEWISSHPSPEHRIETVRALCRARPTAGEHAPPTYGLALGDGWAIEDSTRGRADLEAAPAAQ